MASKSNKGVKLSLGEFIGSSGGPNATSSLPKGPAERAPDDDGSFKRPVRRVDNYNDQPPSRSEGDGNWRRGGPSSNGPSSGFGSSSGSGGNRDNYANNRGGGGGFDNDRGNSNGGFRRDTDSGTSNWRGSSNSRESSVPAVSATSERPRLQLKSRTVPSPTVPPNTTITSPPTSTKPSIVSKPSPFGSANAINTATTSAHPELTEKGVTSDSKSENEPSPVNNDKNGETRPGESSTPSEGVEDGETKVDGETNAEKSMLKQGRKEKVKREPEVINSRAAAFGPGNNIGGNKSESNNDRRDKHGPPPILNPRFEKLAVEERENTGRRDRIPEDKEGPPLVVNSRFAAVAEADKSYTKPDDRGPPPIMNSRFAAAAEADRSTTRQDDHGPPPIANSRFAAAAEADRTYTRPDDRGPPPVANSRFAAAAEADRSLQNHNRDHDDGPPPIANSRFSAAAEADGRSAFSRDDRGPPPMVNSRFAAAAAYAEDEKLEADKRRRERDSFFNRDEPNRGAMPQNSRFAAAAAADSDYVDRESREKSSNRFGDRGDDNYRRNGPGDDGRGSRSAYNTSRHDREYDEPPPPTEMSRVDQLLKPKKEDDVVVVPLTKEHEANILKIPAKAFKKEEESFLAAPIKKKTEHDPVKMEEKVSDAPSVSLESMESLLTEFSSGQKLGEELKEWCAMKKPLPPLEKLIFHMLKNNEKLNPDPNCEWAEPSKYGAAILFLIDDDLHNQIQILWAIQFYCESIGFPKIDGESVVQSMFRAMYKYDLADADAFIEWKEDESDSHEKGKMTAIIQTTEWFNWLEADEDEGDEEDDEME